MEAGENRYGQGGDDIEPFVADYGQSGYRFRAIPTFLCREAAGNVAFGTLRLEYAGTYRYFACRSRIG